MTNLDVVVCLEFDHRASPDGLRSFKESIAKCPLVSTVIELTGTFDLMVHAQCSDVAEYTEQLDRMRPYLAAFVKRLETSFIVKQIQTHPNGDDAEALWLPCEGGMKRVEARMIDKIIAEGDYMRVHVGNWNCLVHYTMRRLRDQLGGDMFIQLHRSCLVRIAFIERVIHEGRRWKVRLLDGTQVSVAKSHVQELLKSTGNESSKLQPNSSTLGPIAERPDSPSEINKMTMA